MRRTFASLAAGLLLATAGATPGFARPAVAPLSHDDIAWLRRASFGVDSVTLARYQQLGRKAWLDEALADRNDTLPEPIQQLLDGYQALNTPPQQLVEQYRDQMKQVFFNIVKNASEAMQPGGRLKIRSWADDENVYLAFADSGAGIKQEDLTRLFQPYHTTKPGGHGLGLMIVQRILREHGGQIGIESKEGVGTVVTLQLPRRDRRVRMLQS